MTQYDKLTLEDLKRHRAQVKQQILETAAQIRAVLVADAPRWINREARRRWLDHVDFATSMEDATLEGFKSSLQTLGQQAASDLDAKLQDEGVWIAEGAPAHGRKSLSGHSVLWPLLQDAACKLSAHLEKFKFPVDDADAPEPAYKLVYQSPMYFVDGAYCPGLIETYWGRLEEYLALEEATAQRQELSSREQLEQRWDNA